MFFSGILYTTLLIITQYTVPKIPRISVNSNMGKVFSTFVRRPLKNWDVDNRAHRLLDKHQEGTSRQTTAPRHPSTAKMFEDFSRENPHLLELQKKKDVNLDKMLKDMVVNPEKMGTIVSAERPLPQNRSPVADLEFGYLEPTTIPAGRCSIKQALEFISHHQMEPGNHRLQSIAKQYKLQPVKVEQVLKYFQTLYVAMPSEVGKAQQELKKLQGTAPKHKKSVHELLNPSTSKTDDGSSHVGRSGETPKLNS